MTAKTTEKPSHRWVCSCGDKSEHVLFTRRTEDNVPVKFWSTGDVTLSAFNVRMRSVGSAREGWSEARNRRANSLIADIVCFYSRAELPRLVRLARKVAGQSGRYDADADRKWVRELMQAAAT